MREQTNRRPEPLWPMTELHGVSPLRNFQRVTCYRVEATRGEGTEADPVRVVTGWFTDDGALISYDDPADHA